MTLLDVQQVEKIYTTRFSNRQTAALQNISFCVQQGEFISIMGESGSGKTTLLNLIATLDQPTGGEILLEGESLRSIRGKNLSAFRREKLGFVFQEYNLLDQFSIRDNILLPLVLSRVSKKEMDQRLYAVAENLKILYQLDKFPYELSGGQCQRAAAARAFITHPQILLADEPTGALDSKSSDMLLETFLRINRQGQTILMVTHSARAASYSNRVLFLRDGEIYHEMYQGERSTTQWRDLIGQSLLMANENPAPCISKEAGCSL